MSFKIGVDGGGTKTECILVNAEGTVVAVHVGAGCNPSIVGADQARSIVLAALDSLRAQATAHTAGMTRAPFAPAPEISATLLCMAGSRAFWSEFAERLNGFGHITALDDSLPVLELATHGKPGLVLHAGTGSFVAARAPDGTVHYAGGLGWRFGDPGSGYDIGQRAVARALLELQGWTPVSRLSALVREHTGAATAAEATRAFYGDAAPNQKISDFAPAVLRLAGDGDLVAQQIVFQSVAGLVDLARGVAEKLFSSSLLDTVRSGLSGPILTHPVVVQAMAARSPLVLAPVEGKPIEGVRRMLDKY
ncbi:MAG TPA: BadF/BadG/BcrA/BcrD ATPase family protein [Opitutaceae bacterium]|nr:BadF/BadG/BcrA/BcrD ATPase family protein [Opitutaceae bacterium]